MNDDLISRKALKQHKFTTQVCNGVEIEDVDVVAVATIDNAPTVDFEKLGESLRCQIRAEYGSCDDCELSCPRNELIKLLDLEKTTGEWIEDSYAGIHCSECDYFPLKDVVIKINADGSSVKRGNWNLTPYCPNCGAKMGKEKKNEFSQN